MKKFLGLLLPLFLLVSCGTPKGKTAATFGLSFATGSYSTGGLMIFGKNNSRPGVYIGKRINTDGQVIELDNGNWDFVSIAWDGANQLEGNVKCASAENINLGGGDVNVGLSLTRYECTDKLFGPKPSKGQVGQFNPLSVVSCNNQKFIQEKNMEQYQNNCVRGATKSFQVIIPEFDEAGNIQPATGLVSGCQNYASALDSRHNSNLKIPIFDDPQAPLTFGIVSYGASNCAGPAEVFDARNDIGSRLAVDFYQSKTHVIINSNYCSGANVTNSYLLNNFNFRGGAWKILCTAGQFKDAFSGANNNLLYILGDDINFQNEDLALVTPMNIAAGGELDGDGYSLYNFSHNYSGTTTNQGVFFNTINGDIKNIGVEQGNVVFDFNGKGTPGTGILFGSIGSALKLKGIYFDNVHMDIINDENASFIERFGLVGGDVTNTGEMEKIEIHNSSITLHSTLGGSDIREVGGIFGRLNGVLKNSLINNLVFYSETGNTIQKTMSLGGAVGRTITSGGLKFVEVNGLTIQLDHSAEAIGGVVGTLNDSTVFHNVSAQGIIGLTENTLTHPDIGGVAGIVSGAGSFLGELITSKVDIDARYGGGGAGPVGGVFGKVTAGPADIKLARYEGTITGKTTCGGIVGQSTSGSGLNKFSFSRGTLNCNGGAAGGIAGNAGTTDVAHAFSDMTVNMASGTGHGGLIGELGAASVLSESYYEGSLIGNSANHGLLVGNCPGCNITNSYSISGGTNQLGVGTVGTPAGATCAILNNGATNQCTDFPNLANLNTSFATPNLTDQNWEVAGDGKFRLKTDKFYNRYVDTVGTKQRPFGLNSALDWKLFADIQEMDVNSQVQNSAFILLNDLDFGSGFMPWKSFGGHFMGNDMTIRNINYTEASAFPTGLFRELKTGALIDHETPNGFKQLFLKDISMIGNTGEIGVLAGRTSGITSSSAIGIYGIQLWNSYVEGGTSNAGGLVGSMTSTNLDSFEIEDIAIKDTTVIGKSATGTGAVIGNISQTGSPINKTIFRVFVDKDVNVNGNVDKVGGIIGDGSQIIGAALVSHANVSGVDNVGGIIGFMPNGTLNTVSSEAEISQCSSNCGGIFGNGGAINLMHGLNMATASGSPIGIFGTQAGATMSNIISHSGNSYNTSSIGVTTAVSYFADPATFNAAFDIGAEAFYWIPGSYPRLRWIDFALSQYQAGNANTGNLPFISNLSSTIFDVAGGSPITIYGGNFDAGAIVTINGNNCTSVTVTPPGQIDCNTPAIAGGTYDIDVINGNGLFTRLPASVVYAPAPTYTSVSPTSGPQAGGTAITIAGNGFVAGATVDIDGVPCTSLTVVSATSITCTTGTFGSLGSKTIVVTNPDTLSATGMSAFTAL